MTKLNIEDIASLEKTFNSSGEFWTDELRAPSNWDYSPSDYGVPGVHLGEPKMIKFNELSDYLEAADNPGRWGIDWEDVTKLKENIERNGIISKGTRMVYVNTEKKTRVNGIKRFLASQELGIDEWMCVPVTYDTELAENDHSFLSNNPTEDEKGNILQKYPTKNDAKTGLINHFNLVSSVGGRDDFNREVIEAEVYKWTNNNPSLTNHNRTWIIDEVYLELQGKGKTKGDRYLKYKVPQMKQELDRLKKNGNEWCKKYWDIDIFGEKSYVCLISLDGSNISGDWCKILSAGLDAAGSRKPLHFVITVGVPKSEQAENLHTKRLKFFTERLNDMEKTICKLLKLDLDHRALLPWNHSAANHVFLRQDSENEPVGKLIDDIPNHRHIDVGLVKYN